MLRITRLNPGEQPAILKLEGRLTGPWVSELARVIDLSAGAAPARIALDLQHVTFADASGVELLRRVDGTRADLRSASSFVGALLEGKSDERA